MRSRAPRRSGTTTYHGLTVTLMMLFCAAQAPEIFGRDQRYGVLPLYFSRAITRTDYVLAKVAGLIVALLIVDLVPQMILFVGRVLVAVGPGHRPEQRGGARCPGSCSRAC